MPLITPFLKYLSGGLLLVCLVLGIALKVEKAHSEKLAKRNTELTVKLDDLAAKSREAQKQTAQTITKYEKVTLPQVERIVREIEKAPLGKNCETPSEIMGADL